MTEQETRSILNMIYSVYPYSFKGWVDDQRNAYCMVWTGIFRNVPYTIVWKAVKNYIRHNSGDYAPKPGQINDEIMSILSPDTELESITAWENLRRYLRKRTGESSIDLVEYNKLDWITRRIYSMDDLRSLSLMDSEKIEYRRTEFQRLYKKLKDKKNEEDLESGDLISLAGGKERFMALGFDESDYNQLGGEEIGSE